MRNQSISLTMVLLVAPICTAVAQDRTPLFEPGTQLRVEACIPGCVEVVGTTYESADADALRILPEGRRTARTIPLASVKKLEIHQGRKSLGSWKGALAGAAFGAAFGAVMWGSGVEWSDEHIGMPEFSPFTDESRSCGAECVAIGAAGGALLGALFGALIKTDRWEEVPLDEFRVNLVPSRDGVALGVALGF